MSDSELIKSLKRENSLLREQLDESNQGDVWAGIDYEDEYEQLVRDYNKLQSDYDDLGIENDDLRHELENQNMTEVIEDIHSLIGNGISAGSFRKIADMLSTKYHVKEPIWGLDYGI